MSSITATSEYSVDNVYQTFNATLDNRSTTDGSIGLLDFIVAFRELNKFFDHLNVVFAFAAHDLINKFVRIEYLCQTDPIHYHTVESMINYEMNTDEKYRHGNSGTVELLRLLRALEFLYLFLSRAIISADESANTKQIAWDIYKETLHKRHSKTVQWSIWFATATVPKRETLKKTLLHGEIEPNTGEKCVVLIENIYQTIYRLYAERDLLELVPL